MPATAVPSATDASGTKEKRWTLSQSKGESCVTAWGTRLGERGGGVRSVMAAILCFLEVAALFFGEREGRGRKIKVGPKKSLTSWSLKAAQA